LQVRADSRPGPGKTIFTTTAGGVTVTFEVTFD